MDLGLKSKIAIVAAASRGIGYAAALELAREGARVFLCSRDEQRASEAAAAIHKETGANVAGIAADVTDGHDTERFVTLALERAGRVDICVTNAGGAAGDSFRRYRHRDVSPGVRVECSLGDSTGEAGSARHARAQVGPHHQRHVDLS